MASKHRLLMVATVSDTVAAFLAPLAAHMRSLGWEVDCLARGVRCNPVCVRSFNRCVEASWSRNPVDLIAMYRATGTVRDLIRETSYDIVHVHSPVAAFWTRFALRGIRKETRTSMMYTAHGFHFHPYGSQLKNSFYRLAERTAGAWTDHLVVINTVDFRAALDHRLVSDPQRITHIPGVWTSFERLPNPQERVESALSLRAELGTSMDTEFMLCIAEFIPRKRHVDLLRALPQVPENVHLLLAGKGRLMRRMEELAHRLQISHRVHFLGFRTDVHHLIRASVLTVLPSEQEGFPAAILESFAQGVPVVATRIRGNEELLRGHGSLTYSPGNVDALAASINWVLDNRVKALKIAEEKFGQYKLQDIRHTCRRYEELYTSLRVSR